MSRGEIDAWNAAHMQHQDAKPKGPDKRYSGITALADGGPAWKGMPFLVGEKGPELFIPGRDGNIIAHDKSRNFGEAHSMSWRISNETSALRLAHESHAFQWLHQLAKGGKEWLSPKVGLGWAQWSGSAVKTS